MRVILQKDVLNLGDAGEIKEVADGYARNYLIPKKLAIKATEGSAKMRQHQKRLAELKKEKRQKGMAELAKKLEGMELTFQLKLGAKEKVFGSITALDIAKALSEKGYELDKRKIDLEQPLKSIGDHKIKLKLAEGIQAQILVKILPGD